MWAAAAINCNWLQRRCRRPQMSALTRLSLPSLFASPYVSDITSCRAEPMLKPLSNEDGSFELLLNEWERECNYYGEEFSEYAAPHIEHARKICAETPRDPRYGIYGIDIDGRHECICHVNVANLPGTTGKTLRVVWVLLAPRYDHGDVSAQAIGALAGDLLNGSLDVAKEAGATAIKLHLSGIGDYSYFAGVVHGIGRTIPLEFAIRGNWLHISML